MPRFALTLTPPYRRKKKKEDELKKGIVTTSTGEKIEIKKLKPIVLKNQTFNIDGTLIPKGENNIPISTLKALEKLQASGVKCFVATGRSLNVVMSLGTNQFNFDGYLTLNGALCYDSHLEKIFGLPFEGDEAEVIARMFIAKKIPFEIVKNFHL